MLLHRTKKRKGNSVIHFLLRDRADVSAKKGLFRLPARLHLGSFMSVPSRLSLWYRCLLKSILQTIQLIYAIG